MWRPPVPKRLKEDDIIGVIRETRFHVFPGTTMTVCCLTLENGYNVLGDSACVSPEYFDAALGESLAYEKAKDKIWALEGYLLKEGLTK